MRLFARIILAGFALAGAVGWIAFVLWFRGLAHALAGMSDGPVAGSALPETLFEAAVWLFPMAAFAFILLGSLDLLKGTAGRIAYWYVQITLAAAALVLLLLCRGYALKLAGVVSMLLAATWRGIFRGTPKPFGRGNAASSSPCSQVRRPW
jgi:hypothetical protein